MNRINDDIHLVTETHQYVLKRKKNQKFKSVTTIVGEYFKKFDKIYANYDFNQDITIPNTNLSGYWKFNDGSGSTVSDNSSNGKNGTIYGATWMSGSHHQPQPGPLVFNAGTQLNLNSPNCGSDHTSLCTNNKIAVNQNIIFTG